MPPIRVLISIILIVAITSYRAGQFPIACLKIIGLAVGVGSCLLVLHLPIVRNAIFGGSKIALDSSEMLKLVFAFCALLGAWLAYLVLINSIRDAILTAPLSLAVLKRQDWWAITIGQLAIFQVLLSLVYWLECSPGNEDFQPPLRAIWVVLCFLTLLNIYTIPQDAALLATRVTPAATSPAASGQ